MELLLDVRSGGRATGLLAIFLPIAGAESLPPLRALFEVGEEDEATDTNGCCCVAVG